MCAVVGTVCFDLHLLLVAEAAAAHSAGQLSYLHASALPEPLATIQQLACHIIPLTFAGQLQQLVMCKMQLAELNESYLSTCHELHKAKEKNLAIAAKMTRCASD